MAHGIGRTKGGRNTKLHAVCDAKGRPLVLLLTPGNVHDCKVAQRCIEAMTPAAELVADKGYDSKALRDWLAERGTTAVIPPRKNRKVQYHYDKTVYRHPAIVNARHVLRVSVGKRLAPYPSPLRIENQKKSDISIASSLETMNHASRRLRESPVMGPDPKYLIDNCPATVPPLSCA